MDRQVVLARAMHTKMLLLEKSTAFGSRLYLMGAGSAWFRLLLIRPGVAVAAVRGSGRTAPNMICPEQNACLCYSES